MQLINNYFLSQAENLCATALASHSCTIVILLNFSTL
jgi:hypothetical protein